MAPLERLYETVPQPLDRVVPLLSSVDFHVVETVDELKAATHLAYREYLKRGYVTPHPSQLKLSVFHALPETTTFIAVHPERGVIGTLSLIPDSPLGLPMEEVYKSELDGLRQQGHRIAEASMLAFDTSLFCRKGLPRFHTTQLVLTLQLFKVMFDYLRCATDATVLVACFNPRHRILYEFLHLQPLGGLKSYSLVNGNPAIAGHLPLAETFRLAQLYPVVNFFWQQAYQTETYLNKLHLSAEDVEDLFVHSSSVLDSASGSELAFLQQCYETDAHAALFKAFMPETSSNIELPAGS